MLDALLPQTRKTNKVYYRLGLNEIDSLSNTAAKNILKQILLTLDIKWQDLWSNLGTLQMARSENEQLCKLAQTMHSKIYDECKMVKTDEHNLKELITSMQTPPYSDKLYSKHKLIMA
jgi:hypothetical protein